MNYSASSKSSLLTLEGRKKRGGGVGSWMQTQKRSGIRFGRVRGYEIHTFNLGMKFTHLISEIASSNFAPEEKNHFSPKTEIFIWWISLARRLKTAFNAPVNSWSGFGLTRKWLHYSPGLPKSRSPKTNFLLYSECAEETGQFLSISYIRVYFIDYVLSNVFNDSILIALALSRIHHFRISSIIYV